MNRNTSDLHSGRSGDWSRRLVDSVGQPMILLDRGLRVLEFNRQFRAAFDVGPDMKAGATLPDLVPDRRLESIVGRALQAGKVLASEEYSLPVDDTHWRHFLITTSVPVDAPDTIALTLQEMTQWRRSHLQTIEADRQAPLAVMAAGMAHEINNPLAAVMGFAQLVQRRSDDPLVLRDLENIIMEARRVSSVVAELQAFAGVSKVRTKTLDVQRPLQKVLEMKSRTPEHDQRGSDHEDLSRHAWCDRRRAPA